MSTKSTQQQQQQQQSSSSSLSSLESKRLKDQEKKLKLIDKKKSEFLAYGKITIHDHYH